MSRVNGTTMRKKERVGNMVETTGERRGDSHMLGLSKGGAIQEQLDMLRWVTSSIPRSRNRRVRRPRRGSAVNIRE